MFAGTDLGPGGFEVLFKSGENGQPTSIRACSLASRIAVVKCLCTVDMRTLAIHITKM